MPGVTTIEELETKVAELEAENSGADPQQEARAHMDMLFDKYAAALNSGDPCEVEPAMDAIKAFARGDCKDYEFGGDNVSASFPPLRTFSR